MFITGMSLIGRKRKSGFWNERLSETRLVKFPKLESLFGEKKIRFRRKAKADELCIPPQILQSGRIASYFLYPVYFKHRTN